MKKMLLMCSALMLSGVLYAMQEEKESDDWVLVDKEEIKKLEDIIPVPDDGVIVEDLKDPLLREGYTITPKQVTLDQDIQERYEQQLIKNQVTLDQDIQERYEQQLIKNNAFNMIIPISHATTPSSSTIPSPNVSSVSIANIVIANAINSSQSSENSEPFYYIKPLSSNENNDALQEAKKQSQYKKINSSQSSENSEPFYYIQSPSSENDQSPLSENDDALQGAKKKSKHKKKKHSKKNHSSEVASKEVEAKNDSLANFVLELGAHLLGVRRADHVNMWSLSE